MTDGRRRTYSGAPWEKRVGYCRALRVGPHVFVTDISRWEEFGRAHAEVFSAHPPATTMVEVRALIHSDMLIEVEADAFVDRK